MDQSSKTLLSSAGILALSPIDSWKNCLKAADKPKSPNIVLIFMDDLGYGDLSCYGASLYKTPNLDRMAAKGIRFTSFLAAQAVCSASRAGILTGCYPNRLGISGALSPNSEIGLNPSEETIAEVVKKRNYRLPDLSHISLSLICKSA